MAATLKQTQKLPLTASKYYMHSNERYCGLRRSFGNHKAQYKLVTVNVVNLFQNIIVLFSKSRLMYLKKTAREHRHTRKGTVIPVKCKCLKKNTQEHLRH